MGTAQTATSLNEDSKINIPLSPNNLQGVPAEYHEDITWFHEHVLEMGFSLVEAGREIRYDSSTVHKVLHGKYQSYAKVVRAIRQYKALNAVGATIKANEIVPNSITRLVAAGIDYALANKTMATITGEARMGKTVAAVRWMQDHPDVRVAYVIAHPFGNNMFMARLLAALGVKEGLSREDQYTHLVREAKKRRGIIVDDAHRLVPRDRRASATSIEVLRDLYDITGCAIITVATRRFNDQLEKAEYQYEQFLGRVGMPIQLPEVIPAADYMPIVQQYIRNPSADLSAACHRIANSRGRLGILVETLKLSSRIAAKAKQPLREEHMAKAIKIRTQMMTGRQRR